MGAQAADAVHTPTFEFKHSRSKAIGDVYNDRGRQIGTLHETFAKSCSAQPGTYRRPTGTAVGQERSLGVAIGRWCPTAGLDWRVGAAMAVALDALQRR